MTESAAIRRTAARGAPYPSAQVADWVERRYDLAVATVEFVRLGENTTYRVAGLDRDFALRICRPEYQTDASLRSELAWTADLRRATGISTPAATPGRDGEPIQPFGERGRAILFDWVHGVPLAESNRPDLWRGLGQVMATIHEHGQTWRWPHDFERPAWGLEAFVGPKPRWGDPLALIEWAPGDRELIAGASEMVRQRLLGFGTDPERYGLIHADLAFENVLVDGAQTFVLDFDDGGYGWFAYDLAVSLFARELEPGFRERRCALLEGYQDVRALSDRSIAELPTFLMARRLATLGWTLTRGETAHASRLRDQRIAQAPDRCRDFLAWCGSR